MYFENIIRHIRFSLIVIIPLFILSCAEPAQKIAPDPLATTAHDFMVQVIEQEKISGAVAILARDGEIIFYEAHGMADRENGIPMKKDSLFRIASMTKAFTSVAIMMLYDDGLLMLDDPISKYIPEFESSQVLIDDGSRDTTPVANPITIRHLLTHTSGISYQFIGIEPLANIYGEAGVSDGLTQTEGTISEGIKKLAALPLLHEPGTKWTYGLSTDVLGYLVEVVSGKKLDVFFSERIFKPLNLNDTGFFLSPDQSSRLATVYTSKEGGGIDRLGESPITKEHLTFSTSFHYDSPQTYFSGGAGLYSSTEDYFHFLNMLANGGKQGDVRLLKEETANIMHQNQIGDIAIGSSKNKMGLGFYVKMAADGSGSKGTYGWGGFFHTSYWIDPEKKLIGVFMSQLRPSKEVKVTKGFIKAIYSVGSDPEDSISK